MEQGRWIGDFGNMFCQYRHRLGEWHHPATLFAIFQMTFAIITPALIVGGFAERARFSAMLLFSTLWMVLVYAPGLPLGVGWRLAGSMGLQDFAGGTVVHITAAAAAWWPRS